MAVFSQLSKESDSQNTKKEQRISPNICKNSIIAKVYRDRQCRKLVKDKQRIRSHLAVKVLTFTNRETIFILWWRKGLSKFQHHKECVN